MAFLKTRAQTAGAVACNTSARAIALCLFLIGVLFTELVWFYSLFACATSVSAGCLSQCRRITVDTQYHLLVSSSKSAHKLGETACSATRVELYIRLFKIPQLIPIRMHDQSHITFTSKSGADFRLQPSDRNRKNPLCSSVLETYCNCWH